MHQSHRLRGWTFNPYESVEERLIASAVCSIKAHMSLGIGITYVGSQESLSLGLVNIWRFSKPHLPNLSRPGPRAPQEVLSYAQWPFACDAWPSVETPQHSYSLTQINLLAASFCDKKTQPTSNKNCSGSSQTKLQTSIPCGRGIWCLTHGNPHEGKHDTSTCSFTLDNRPARCSFMLQVCNLCILRNRYSRFRPVRILLHCTRLNTEHLSGAFAHAGGQDNHNLFSGQTLKQILECWTVHTTKAFFQDSSGIFELFGDSTTPEYSGPLFSKVTNKECAAVSWNFAIRAYPKSCNQTCHPRPSGGQASPVATNQSCPSKNTRTIWTNLEIHEKSLTCCKSDAIVLLGGVSC